jgi:hypothetical protein
MELLIDPSALVNQTLFPNLVFSRQEQAVKFNQTSHWKMEQVSKKDQIQGTSNDSELLDAVESSDSSPQNNMLTLDTFAFDSSPDGTIEFASLDEYFMESTDFDDPFHYTA